MKTINLKVKNMKCMGCANTILGNLTTLAGISNVNADLVTQTVTFDYESEVNLEQALSKLRELGYPAEKQ